MAFNEILPNYNRMECYLKRFSCHIEANGFVYPCIVLINKYKALNFLEVGFEKAWKNLENCDCKACYNICTNDLNRTFGFRPEVIWNSIKISLGRIVHERKS
jgi:MoaA/NifB/PqqE/SkfB family radical SAM enzyme